MADLAALRDVNERLRPLRRIMDDLQMAVAALGDVEGQIADKAAHMGQLDIEKRGLEDEIAQLRLDVQDASDRHDEMLLAMEAARHLAQAELVVFKEGLERERVAEQHRHDDLLCDMNQHHESYMSVLAAQKQAAALEYDSLCSARDALKAQIKGLL